MRIGRYEFFSAALLLPLVTLASCAVTQAVQSRNRVAEATKGAEVSGGGFDRPIEHTGRIRVYASQEYKAQRAGWEGRVKHMVASATGVLGPAFGVQLEVVETAVWRPDCDPAKLRECLQELSQYDPGDDVDWVVGLVAAVPRFTTAFEEMGMANVPGRHFVLRDLYASGEREAINDMFPQMSAPKRDEIYKERQKHKRLVIFLHEWGHTMGALHTRNDYSILYPGYDSEMAGFSEENLHLIDAALADRFPLDPAFPALSEFIAANDSEVWMPGARDRLLTALGLEAARAASPRKPAPSTVKIAGDDEQLLAGVTVEDRARYAKASAQFEAGDLDASWVSLEPLLDRYPDCYAIQHFGCSLAMHVGARQQAGSSCRRAIDLAGDP